jgi:glucose-6-phosphate 1-dehydrogenase
MSDEDWQNKLAETTKEFAAGVFTPQTWNEFKTQIHYHAGDISDTESFQTLKQRLEQLEGNTDSDRLYYLSTAPKFYAEAAEQLGKAGLAVEAPGHSRRLVIEKPFGTDGASADALNEVVHRHFQESQIYRIDHYLGKETVNNVLVLRFANAIFEPIWNRNYIENIQITANEDVLVGRRAPYYETAGVLRDMFQNHLLQILTFAAMEPPANFDAKAVRDEKVKVLQSIRPMTTDEVLQNTVRGQYRSYRDEQGVAANSSTATYAAVKLMIDNWRWKGVPMFLRSGKGMSCRSTQIVIQFRRPPHLLFNKPAAQPAALSSVPGNRLLIQIQPAEGIQLYFMTKVPDTEMNIQQTELTFNFQKSFRGTMPDSYQRLLLDALHGDASLFARSDEVAAAWNIIDPIQKTWDSGAVSEPDFYELGSFGPVRSHQWIAGFGQEWFDLCPVV